MLKLIMFMSAKYLKLFVVLAVFMLIVAVMLMW